MEMQLYGISNGTRVIVSGFKNKEEAEEYAKHYDIEELEVVEVYNDLQFLEGKK